MARAPLPLSGPLITGALRFYARTGAHLLRMDIRLQAPPLARDPPRRLGEPAVGFGDPGLW